jgi:hypothetical protein
MRRRLRRWCAWLLVLALALAPGADAATLFHLTDTASTKDSSYMQMSSSAGAGVQTSTTNLIDGDGALGGTRALVTKTTGGTVLKWLSEPLGSATIVGNMTIQLRDAKESATAGNAQFVCVVSRWDYTNESIDATGQYSIDMNAELTTSLADYPISLDPLFGIALNNGDRLAVLCYVDDAPGVTMSGTSSKTASFRYAQTSSDMTVQVAEALVAASASPTPTVTGGATATPSPTPTATPAVVQSSVNDDD